MHVHTHTRTHAYVHTDRPTVTHRRELVLDRDSLQISSYLPVFSHPEHNLLHATRKERVAQHKLHIFPPNVCGRCAWLLTSVHVDMHVERERVTVLLFDMELT